MQHCPEQLVGLLHMMQWFPTTHSLWLGHLTSQRLARAMLCLSSSRESTSAHPGWTRVHTFQVAMQVAHLRYSGWFSWLLISIARSWLFQVQVKYFHVVLVAFISMLSLSDGVVSPTLASQVEGLSPDPPDWLYFCQGLPPLAFPLLWFSHKAAEVWCQSLPSPGWVTN